MSAATAKVSAKLPAEVKDAAEKRVEQLDAVPSLSYVVAALLELWVAGDVDLPAPPATRGTYDRHPDRAERVAKLGKLVREQGASVYAAAKEVGVTYRTGVRWLAEYDLDRRTA